ncbi:MAG TPA: FGGY family carbohydrate kinase, partial [Oceanipulchritudo sp.]|nr:FGGY family carbohydrate kinase [Oceanipulchritudo sp.]
MPLFLSVDQSTSATKALLIDQTGRIFDRESREHTQHYPLPGFVEHDAEEIYRNTLAVCEAVLQRCENRDQVAFLSISNQRETVVVFDRKTGKPLHRAIVWQCRRGTEICEKLKAQGAEPEVHQRTGLTLDPYFSASKVHWLIQAHPELADKLRSGEAVLGTIDAYLIYRLTNGVVFATDHTNASRTLLYNISTCTWDPSLCELWGIPNTALPEPRSCSDSFGTVAVGGLVHGLEIRGVMGDSHASLFAQRCFASGTTKLTLGTGSSILMNIGNQPVFSTEGVMTTLAWVHDCQPVYALEGIIVCAAASLTWLRSQLGIIANPAEAEAMATELAGNDGVYLVPAFSGLGLPHWSPSAKAVISGLSNHSDRRHIVRAALEAIAYQIRDA